MLRGEEWNVVLSMEINELRVISRGGWFSVIHFNNASTLIMQLVYFAF